MEQQARPVVLLTGVGAEGQVGEIVAATFASSGASLVLVDHRPAQVEARAAAVVRAGGQARAYACDLTEADAVDALAAEVRANHGARLDAVVHMAGGFAMTGPVAESDVGVWTRQLAINLTTAYLTARAFVPMLRGGGSLVFFASEAALPGASVANKAAYSIAKNGVVTLMRAIAAEERKSGVRANAVAPTAIRTRANLSAMGRDVRYVEREEVAAVLTYLCSPAASAITGAVIPLS